MQDSDYNVILKTSICLRNAEAFVVIHVEISIILWATLLGSVQVSIPSSSVQAYHKGLI